MLVFRLVIVSTVAALFGCAPSVKHTMSDYPESYFFEQPLKIISMERSPQISSGDLEGTLEDMFDDLAQTLPSELASGFYADVGDQWLRFEFLSKAKGVNRDIIFECQLINSSLGSSQGNITVEVRFVRASGKPLDSRGDIVEHWNYVAKDFEKAAASIGGTAPFVISVWVPSSGV